MEEIEYLEIDRKIADALNNARILEPGKDDYEHEKLIGWNGAMHEAREIVRTVLRKSVNGNQSNPQGE